MPNWRERYARNGGTSQIQEARRRADLEAIAATAAERESTAIALGVVGALLAVVAFVAALAYDAGAGPHPAAIAAPCGRR